MKLASATWLGPPLLTLQGPDFGRACADLMRLVEADYAPTLIIGIRTGGLVVAQAMADATSPRLPVLPLTCRRVTTAAKSRLPLLRTLLGILPRPVVNQLRRLEHRIVTAGRAQHGRRQEVDHAEVTAIADHLAAVPSPPRILIADDAVDSGVTLATVLRLVDDVCPAGGEIRSAAITQTLESPTVRPDYLLFRGTLCRFPWSFDAAG
jgi:hypoxanthine phosphoribosyltransferase